MTRIAHIWTRRGLVDVPVKDFPQTFALGRWLYDADLAQDGGLLVRAKNGVETVEYRSRRQATSADRAAMAAADYAPAFRHDDTVE